eukprot:TRINITY_DN22671_c0_g1_i1.p1 TRINITY_DN22671_c0_g1~~TRINITY_DN22671_c0_g1_i1.p1  ORF type:complete len:631 (+),score=100.46 TRINITY_DN22671_c0_g1_i1:47-1939(+)
MQQPLASAKQHALRRRKSARSVLALFLSCYIFVIPISASLQIKDLALFHLFRSRTDGIALVAVPQGPLPAKADVSEQKLTRLPPPSQAQIKANTGKGAQQAQKANTGKGAQQAQLTKKQKKKQAKERADLALELRPPLPAEVADSGKQQPQGAAEKQRKSSAKELNQDLLIFAAKRLPRKSDRKKRQGLLKILRDVARTHFKRRSINIFPFGSSATGLGDVDSDVDAVLSYGGELSPDKALRQMRSELRSRRSRSSVINITMFLPSANIPLLTMSQRGLMCDLSCDNLIPLFNTRLLRSYTEMYPHMSILASVVKRWSKRKGVNGAGHGYLSSYGWTLMIVYYLQVCMGLPSLHALCPEGRGREVVQRRAHEVARVRRKKGNKWKSFAFNFASPTSVEVQKSWNPDAIPADLSDLLRGFFDFYSNSFDWGTEVVSVRLGNRNATGDYLKPSSLLFSIEDPIEVSRNLNFPFKNTTLCWTRQAIDSAHAILEDYGKLSDLIGDDFQKGEQPPPLAKEDWLKGVVRFPQEVPPEAMRLSVTPLVEPGASEESTAEFTVIGESTAELGALEKSLEESTAELGALEKSTPLAELGALEGPTDEEEFAVQFKCSTCGRVLTDAAALARHKLALDH